MLQVGHNLGSLKGEPSGSPFPMVQSPLFKDMSDLIETQEQPLTTAKRIEKSQNGTLSASDRLFANLAPLVEALGYELVHIEAVNHREKILRIFIDLLGPRVDADGNADGVGVQDCVIVTRGLDEPLDTMTELDSIFGGTYELEVSSPGVDRPLRRSKDFEKFVGRDVRINTFRPLTAEELGNADYSSKNPKQKNFIGILGGMDVSSNHVKLTVLASMGAASKTQKPKKGAKLTDVKKDDILIPMALISKANIEPDFDLS